MREATQKQLQILNVVRTLIDQRGYPPSIQEIGDYVGLAKSTVFKHLAALERKGLIKVDHGKARAFQVVASG